MLPGVRSLGVVRQGHDSLVGKKQQASEKLWQTWRWWAPQFPQTGTLQLSPRPETLHPSSLRASSLWVTAGGETIPCHSRLFLRWEVWRQAGSLPEGFCCSISALCTVLPQPQGRLANPAHLTIHSKKPLPLGPAPASLITPQLHIRGEWALQTAKPPWARKWLGRQRTTLKKKRESLRSFPFLFKTAVPFCSILNGCQGDRARESRKVIWILGKANALFKNTNWQVVKTLELLVTSHFQSSPYSLKYLDIIINNILIICKL